MLFINVLRHENASCITSPLWAKPTLTGGSSHKWPMMQSSRCFVVSRKKHLNEQSSYRWFQTAWLSFDVTNIICDFCVLNIHIYILCHVIFCFRTHDMRHRDGCGCPLANKPAIVTRNWFPSQIHNIKQSYYCVNMHTRGLGQVTTINRWHFWIKPSISSLTTGIQFYGLYKTWGIIKTNLTSRNHLGYVTDVSKYHNAGIWSMD